MHRDETQGVSGMEDIGGLFIKLLTKLGEDLRQTPMTYAFTWELEQSKDNKLHIVHVNEASTKRSARLFDSIEFVTVSSIHLQWRRHSDWGRPRFLQDWIGEPFRQPHYCRNEGLESHHAQIHAPATVWSWILCHPRGRGISPRASNTSR